MSLEAASAHIQQVVGGQQLAAEILRLRLASGDVEAQRRQVIPDVGIEIIPLAPETFKGRDALSDDLGPLVRSLSFRGLNIFLRRADVHRIWPIAVEGRHPATALLLTTEKSRHAALPATQPKGIGPKVWIAINTVWELWTEGYQWSDREHLLQKVCERIGDNGLSQRTLDKALAYLRPKRLFDR